MSMSTDEFEWMLIMKDHLTRFTPPFGLENKEAVSVKERHVTKQSTPFILVQSVPQHKQHSLPSPTCNLTQ